MSELNDYDEWDNSKKTLKGRISVYDPCFIRIELKDQPTRQLKLSKNLFTTEQWESIRKITQDPVNKYVEFEEEIRILNIEIKRKIFEKK